MGIPNKVFAKIKPISPSEWNKKIIISYSFFASPFGKIVVASISQGVCFTGFFVSREKALQELRNRFPKGVIRRQKNKQHEHVRKLFSGNWEKGEKLVLCMKGTEFQLKVWEALLKIKTGKLTTYGKIAASIGYPKAQRAVGTAVGRNPVSYIIPCHRVIAQSGKMGGYYWGIEKKMELLSAENTGYLHFTSSLTPSRSLSGML